MIHFLDARAIAGLEFVTRDSYSRVIELRDVTGSITVAHEPHQSALRVAVRFPRLNALSVIVARIRRMFDLSAEPGSIASVLSSDQVMSPLVLARPGLRVPGAWDGFEIAVRAVLGQQITLKAATPARQPRRFCGWHTGLQTVFTYRGSPMLSRGPSVSKPTHWPMWGFLERARLPLQVSYVPTRICSIHAVISLRPLRAFAPSLVSASGPRNTSPCVHSTRVTRSSPATSRFRGGSPWTDWRPTASELLVRAERWRPWRAYAVLHLWMADKDAAQTSLVKEACHASCGLNGVYRRYPSCCSSRTRMESFALLSSPITRHECIGCYAGPMAAIRCERG